jgi:hypothetical protein
VIHAIGSLPALGEWAAVLTAFAGAVWSTFKLGAAYGQAKANLKALEEATAKTSQDLEKLAAQVAELEVKRRTRWHKSA